MLEPLSPAKVRQEAEAVVSLSKFEEYLFVPEHPQNKEKWKMFASWGYDIKDSEWMREEVERQGLKKYIEGEYELGLLNKYGQRISIRVEIPDRIANKSVSYITGWMVYPSGEIRLNTPYGGK